jgi:hypothetical protein
MMFASDLGFPRVLAHASLTDAQTYHHRDLGHRPPAPCSDRDGSEQLAKHVWRAQIVLLTADGCGTMELTRRTGTSKTSVWRWQERFVAEGVPGLLRDKDPPGAHPTTGSRGRGPRRRGHANQTTHWTSVAMARHIGISVSSVQRVWRKHRALSRRGPPTPGKILDNFGFTAVPMLSKARVMALAADDVRLDKASNLLLFGKSHCVSALGRALIENGYRVLFARTTDID